MEQRRLRLGDTLDDYCPRERRVTNHAIVAMIEDDIKQTRCTTCDAEHAYKGGKPPRRRKKDAIAGPPVLASAAHETDSEIDEPAMLHHEESPLDAAESETATSPAEEPVVESQDDAFADASPDPVEEGPVHRPLIRATLPRPEGQKEERRAPEFTIRQPGGRGGHFHGDARMKRQGPGQDNGNGNMARPHGGPRFAGARPSAPGRGATGRGGPGPFRGGQPRHGGKKRSR
jgi:hypothetical protein